MTGKIWLVVEDRNDGAIIKKILIQRNIQSKVEVRQPSSGGISRLAQELDGILQFIRKRMSRGDCVLVIHDHDELTRPLGRQDYDLIADICKQNPDIAVEVIARDELEAWLLADSGVCHWLGRKPEKADGLRRPSDKLHGLIQEKTKAEFGGRYRDQLVANIAGDGDAHSPSMREAFAELDGLDCVKA